MEQPSISWGPVAGAALAIVLLNLTGMLWLGVSQERARADIAQLARQVRETPAPPAPADLSLELKSLRESLDTLAAKVDGLAATADPKAVARLAAEMKNLSNRVEALAAVKAAPAKAVKPAQPARPAQPAQTAPPRPIIEDDQPPRPFYGPGYPAWPGY